MSIQPDLNSPDLGEWRLHLACWVEAIDGVPVPEPTPLHQMSACELPSESLSFHTPSAAALHLNAAWKAARRAANEHAQLRWATLPMSFSAFGPGSKASRQITGDSVGTLFDFLEDAAMAAMCSYAAIEAFCNTTLVEKLRSPIYVKRKKDMVLMSAREIEESVTTDEKLKRLVPDALGISTPAGKKVWEKYKRLKFFRDSLTHFKRRDMTRETAEPTALHSLIEEDPFDAPETAMAVIGYFGEKRWLLNPAWRRP